MRIIICGIGKIFELHKNEINKEDIVCFADNDTAKQGHHYFGKNVISPREISAYLFDAVVVFTSQRNFEEISNQLIMEVGVDCRKVLKWDYYLGKKYYNVRMIANVLTSFFRLANVKEILDIGAVIGQNQLWNTSGTIDLLIESSQFDFLGIYRKAYRKKEAVTKQYDLVLIDSMYLKEYTGDQLTAYAKMALCILPFDDAKNLMLMTDETWSVINLAGYLFGYIRKSTKSIKVFEVSHKKFTPLMEKCYIPIYVGSGRNISGEGMQDGTGDHISQWNPQINECTALYWMWKNTDYEVLGLNHYRRFFKSEINSFMLQTAEIELWMDGYDILVASKYCTSYTVETALKNSVCEDAYAESMRCLGEIVKGMGAVERAAFQYVFYGHTMYPCNMFIASKKVISEYCDWLFPILFQLLEKVEIKEEWDAYSKRIIGFIAERLFTVWIVQQKYKVKELEFLLVRDKVEFDK